ncbi:acyloxyacyl hydrolase [Paraburkholderia tropica]|uniref:acyloxyacyl hydrolase n=1 Tax=Paraburkholderia tropica TaxID=92647 RepID=UPI003D271CE5
MACDRNRRYAAIHLVFGVAPAFRFIKDAGWFRPFPEAGARTLTHAELTPDRSLSSAFQFADMVGVSAQFGDHQNYQAARSVFATAACEDQ